MIVQSAMRERLAADQLAVGRVLHASGNGFIGRSIAVPVSTNIGRAEMKYVSLALVMIAALMLQTPAHATPNQT